MRFAAWSRTYHDKSGPTENLIQQKAYVIRHLQHPIIQRVVRPNFAEHLKLIIPGY